MNITPIKQQFLKVLSRTHKTLKDISSKQWTICSREREIVPPAIFLKNDLDKVKAVMEDTTIEQELTRIHGGEVEHAATVAYQIFDCELLDGSLYKGSFRLPLTKQPKRLIGANVNEFISEGALAGTYYGSFYFGHWLTDDLTLYLTAELLGKPVTPARSAYSHEIGYQELLSIKPNPVTRARFGSLIICDDYGQNSLKKKRYEEFRTRLLKIPSANPGGRVFIRRGQQGAARSLVNSTVIEQVLQSEGFRILDPEYSSVNEIVEATRDAKIIVGVEGSHMLHCIYSIAQNGGICIIQPPYRFNNVLKNYSDCLGMTYGFITGHACENGFSIDPTELLHVIDKIDKSLNANV